MLGLMQSRPLLISGLADYASTWHGDGRSFRGIAEGAIHRSTYAEVVARAKRLANALDALGATRAIGSRRSPGTAIVISKSTTA